MKTNFIASTALQSSTAGTSELTSTLVEDTRSTGTAAITHPEAQRAFDSPQILVGDARERLAELHAESAQCCVTSPPYWGLRDYDHTGQLGAEPSPELYVANLVEIARGVKRVLRPDGTLWLNLGDAYARNGGTGNCGPNALVGNTRKQIQKRNCRVPACWASRPEI